MTPTGLSAASRRLWRRVTEEFELAPGELLIFESLCRTRDELAELQTVAAEVAEAGELFQETNTGQVKPHPVLEEIRRHRVLLERQAASLNLPHLPGTKPVYKPPSAASNRARKAAMARWGTRGDSSPAAG
jgi:hypothetical protein